MSISFLGFDAISAPRTKPGTERKSDQQKSDKEKADEAVEEAEEESFPASDAPAYPDFLLLAQSEHNDSAERCPLLGKCEYGRAFRFSTPSGF